MHERLALAKATSNNWTAGRSSLLWFLQRSGLITALAAAGFVTLLFSSERTVPPAPLLYFVAILTAGAYAIDRLADCQASWLARASVACLATLGLATTTFGAESPSVFRLLLMAVVIVASVLVYSFPLLPGGRRVKDVPFLKAFYVGLAWATLFAASIPVTATSVLVLALVYARVVMGAIASDIKDVEEDRARGVITFPVRYGPEATLQYLQLGHGVLAGLYAVTVCTRLLPPAVLLGGVDAALAAFVLRWLSEWRPEKIGLGTDLLLEATACLPLLGLWL